MATLHQHTKFAYEPLDTTQQSIRVISVDPELSPEGFVQCSIRHTTIDSQYNCLSYRWGPPDFSNTVIVNGQTLSINGYLHDFLTEVRTFTYKGSGHFRTSHLRDSLWIDAVCIDQNSTSEKNHQVAQMGRIYMNANRVIMWPGNRYSEYDKRAIPRTTFENFHQFILSNHYWTRAWIVQEVMLAKNPVLMIADRFAHHLVPFKDFIESDVSVRGRKIWEWVEDSRDYYTHDVLFAWKRMIYDRSDTAKKPKLVEWLNVLRGVKCTLIHDHIFSLLELAEEGRHILVDYDMPPVELIYNVFRARRHEVCLCEVLLLINVLKIKEEAIDISSPCVYVQWKPGSSSSRSCSGAHQATSREHLKWSRLGIVRRFGQMIAQAPLQSFVRYDTAEICPGAIQGTPTVPVQVELGPVYEWQLVSENGKKFTNFPATLLEQRRRMWAATAGVEE